MVETTTDMQQVHCQRDVGGNLLRIQLGTERRQKIQSKMTWPTSEWKRLNPKRRRSPYRSLRAEM